ncbi:hypothetical protein NEPAR06_0906 [Nematocida parisii]|uniref:Uncharacterized protein n=1 Tax=Nematocida parisii (strain ERTm3) TaxID=935791 RepID=I3EDU2_NEMP3|nr:hypothetical protein NEQG_02512 [Nematocida parisii ERTm3]KAI5127555.1 hypothetical protein NEPAR08_0925 [Nematocida parisii]KAI5127830.1 hypothetical protein NEPAR03_1110 [Nematocida parisii]KAI5141654.1 hypothetical protein NEPAR04_1131 [Nematocida parisii]KAI5145505.1 hypothetical protein NEPAR07_1735 [Nematocida parisii]
MSGENKATTNRKKIELLVHIVLIGLALVGSVVNIQRLFRRKEEAIKENIEVFQRGYSGMLKGVASIIGKKDSLHLSETVYPSLIPSNSDSDLDHPILHSTAMNEPLEKGTSMDAIELINSLMEAKVRNPFLFGFKDIGTEVCSTLHFTYRKKGFTEGFKHSTEVKQNIEAFFKGKLPMDVCEYVFDMFYFLIMDMDPKHPDALNITQEKLDCFDKKKEYLIAACYLGEIATAVLGGRVSAMEFASRELSLTEEEFLKSRTRLILNLGSIQFQ